MRTSILLVFLGMALATYVSRAVPLLLLSMFRLPRRFVRWLSYMPVAVLAALVTPDLLLRSANGTRVLWLSKDNLRLLASIPTMLVAIRTRNLFLCVAVGLASIFLLNFLF